MKSKELAEAHWKYVESVLIQHNVSDWERAIAKHHYIAAFVHGYKHAKEEQPISVANLLPPGFKRI